MKDLSNILLGTQSATAPGSAGSVVSSEARALSKLGELANNSPELALLLNEENVDFKALLEGMSHEEAQALVDSVNNGVNVLEAKQATLASELSQTLQKEPMVQPMLQTGDDARNLQQFQNGLESNPTPQTKENIQAILNKSAMTAEEPVVDTSQMKQAEDATRAFMPKRKSIFQVNQNQNLATQNTQANANQLQTGEDAMSLNQFMQNQSASGKQRIAQNQYQNEAKSMFAPKAEVAKLDGIKNNENTMKNVDSLQSAVTQNSSTSENMDLSGGEHSFDGDENLHSQVQQVKAPTAMAATAKVFDMSTLQNAEKTQDVINQIQNYIIQSKVSNEQSVQMTFNHAELGNVDLQVMKASGDNIHVFINAQSSEGAKFFQQNQGELLQNLQQAGLQVAEFKLESSSSSNNSHTNQDSSRQFQGQERQHAEHEHNKRDNESERRRELWQSLQNEREMA